MRGILLLGQLTLAAVNGLAQQETELQARLASGAGQYSLSANDLADAVAKVSKQFQLPVGIEWVKDKQTHRHLGLTGAGETVKDILGLVVEQYPGYAFRVENGVVHVFQHDLVYDGSNFLNLKVPDFFEVRQEGGGFANWRLQDVVQNIVSPRNLPPGAGWAGSYATGIKERPLTLTLRGATVREALEKLADASEYKIWIVTFSDTPALTPTGFRRTETIWHPTPFPDSDQPMWDFIAWEYVPLPIAPAQR